MASPLTRALLVTICASAAVTQELVDLSHELDGNTVYWPGNPTYQFNILSRGDTGDFWYESNNFSTAEHGGTHLDAPAHFSEGKWRVHQIPLEHLIGPGVVIDISARARDNPDTQVEITDILEWEKEHGQLPERAMVLMNSGWSPKWPNKTEVLGSSNPNDSSTFHFPGFNPVTTRWLVENRNYINAIGVDTPSIDYGMSTTFGSHVAAFAANIVGLENVANLDKIPSSGTVVYAIPIKLHDGSGSPLRIFAMTNPTSSAHGFVTPPAVLSSVFLFLAIWTLYLSIGIH